MDIALFSQSLFALSLEEAIEATAQIGFPAIELACGPPHLDLPTARSAATAVAARIERAGLRVSCLSCFNSLTERARLDGEVQAAAEYIRLAGLFGSRTVKLTPGRPASAEASDGHWDCLAAAVERLAPVAQQAGVRLAFETHMRQLTDTLASSHRFLLRCGGEVVGLTVDFSNLAFAGDDPAAAMRVLGERTYNAHVKNGHIEPDGSWRFTALSEGLTDYPEVLREVRAVGYDGYLAIECLGPEAAVRPRETAARDLAILRGYLARAKTARGGTPRGGTA